MKKHIYTGLMLALTAYICLQHCNTPQQKDNLLDTTQVNELIKAQEALKEADSLMMLKDSLIESQGNIISSKVIEAGSVKKVNGKLIKQIAKLKHEIKAKKIEVKYVDKIVVKEIDKSQYMKIPQKFRKEDKYISLTGEVTNKGVTLNNPQVNLNETLVLAEKRDKWYKKKYIEATFYTKNPYDNIKQAQVYKYSPKSKWYQSNWLKFGLGLAAGALVF